MMGRMLGIIGGTGLYKMEGLQVTETREVETPFGKPSAPLVLGKLETQPVAFLPRHGNHHELLPSEIGFRANIWALKAVGVRRVISVSAVGSLVQEIAPGDLAIPNQYFDWTKGKRAASFFGEGLSAHISTAEPVCPRLAAGMFRAAQRADVKTHTGMTYACVEGPRLGTRAESFFLRGAGCHLVGMTNIPEAFLAREAQLCYCTVAIATDYDCWMDDPAQHVSTEKVLELYAKTLGHVKTALRNFLREPGTDGTACRCREALKGALITDESGIPRKQAEILAFLRK